MQRVIDDVEPGAALIEADDELAVMGTLLGPADVTDTLWVNFEGAVSGPVTVRDGGRVISIPQRAWRDAGRLPRMRVARALERAEVARASSSMARASPRVDLTGREGRAARSRPDR
jgi:hypothetical protein